jgi:hypothetical protein
LSERLYRQPISGWTLKVAGHLIGQVGVVEDTLELVTPGLLPTDTDKTHGDKPYRLTELRP